MIRILVTGANGFLGWHVTQQLAKTDYEIHATSRNRPLDLPLTVQFHCANLLESGVPENLIKTVRPTHLLHFAWDARPNLFWTSLENLKWVASSIELYQAFACEGGKRTVFAGSCAEYDWTYRELSENSTPLEPATLYGVCKDALRRMIESSALQNNISFAWGRLFWLYGPKEPPGRLISDLIKTLNAEEQFHCSLGLQRRDFMHVSDAASGFIQLLMSDIQGPINIASGQTHKVAEIISLGAELMGRTNLVKFGTLPSRVNDPSHISANVKLLNNSLNFHPRYNLSEGLENTISWWREQKNSLGNN